MVKSNAKTRRELLVFRQFLREAGLPYLEEMIENRPPPEPDILYAHPDDGIIAFELVEICSEEIAELVTRATNDALILASDPSRRMLRKKLLRKYGTKRPIELICYTEGRVITPDGVIIDTVKPILASQKKFRRIWLLGDRLHRLHPDEHI